MTDRLPKTWGEWGAGVRGDEPGGLEPQAAGRRIVAGQETALRVCTWAPAQPQLQASGYCTAMQLERAEQVSWQDKAGSSGRLLTTMRHLFLRSVGMKNRKVKQPQVASMRHCPTLKPASAGVKPSVACRRAMVLMKDLGGGACQGGGEQNFKQGQGEEP